MDVSNVTEQYTQLIDRRKQTLLEAKRRQGQRPRDRKSREEAYGNFMVALMLRGNKVQKHMIHSSFIPPAYLPCTTPMTQLRRVAIKDLQLETHHRGISRYDPPWWLLLLGPDMWLERRSTEEFLARYEPKMEQFLRALERVEAKTGSRGKQSEELRLSARMRDSWKTGRFWFNYAARKSLDVDAVYWNVLHEDGAGVELLDEETRAEMEPFTQMKMKQLKAYREQYATRLSQKEIE